MRHQFYCVGYWIHPKNKTAIRPKQETLTHISYCDISDADSFRVGKPLCGSKLRDNLLFHGTIQVLHLLKVDGLFARRHGPTCLRCKNKLPWAILKDTVEFIEHE